LYIKLCEGVNTPKWQLSGFKRINLAPGEEKVVDFELKPRQMVAINDDGKCILAPGKFEIFVGGSQPDERSQKLTGTKVLKTSYELIGEAIELEY
jgi:beta-glucosidase